ncbi:MAG: AAA family ATPase [Lachnospiraceae bacterium]|nr:AAA family ATPase [Lachnospiraceae bacterium]
MLYLASFDFPTEDTEWQYRLRIKLTYYDSIYPFYIMPKLGLTHLAFRPITILYGGNGSGKSTILNVIAEKARLRRDSVYNRSPFFEDYVDLCSMTLEEAIPLNSRIITSDDVFDFMLGVRCINEGVDSRREELAAEYQQLKHDRTVIRTLDDYDRLRERNDARRKTQSKWVKDRLQASIREQSNGESSDYYFKSRILEDTLCLLDEPENSLSPENQQKLADYLVESVRYCGCQLIISTHSPFLLALPDARIIDLDNGCREVEDWTDLKNIRIYYDFFEKFKDRFREK